MQVSIYLWKRKERNPVARGAESVHTQTHLCFKPLSWHWCPLIFLDNSRRTLLPSLHPAKPECVLTTPLLLAFPRVVLMAQSCVVSPSPAEQNPFLALKLAKGSPVSCEQVPDVFAVGCRTCAPLMPIESPGYYSPRCSPLPIWAAHLSTCSMK